MEELLQKLFYDPNHPAGFAGVDTCTCCVPGRPRNKGENYMLARHQGTSSIPPYRIPPSRHYRAPFHHRGQVRVPLALMLSKPKVTIATPREDVLNVNFLNVLHRAVCNAMK